MLGDMMARHLDRSSFYRIKHITPIPRTEYENKVTTQVQNATKEAMKYGGRFNWVNLDRSI
jgi:hypothetical protein